MTFSVSPRTCRPPFFFHCNSACSNDLRWEVPYSNVPQELPISLNILSSGLPDTVVCDSFLPLWRWMNSIVHCLFTFINLILWCVCECDMHIWVCMCHGRHEEARAGLWSHFSPSTLTWDLGTELRPSAFVVNTFTHCTISLPRTLHLHNLSSISGHLGCFCTESAVKTLSRYIYWITIHTNQTQ